MTRSIAPAFPSRTPYGSPSCLRICKGRLVAYISNEAPEGPGFSQLLEHKISPDGGRNWGPAIRDVAIGDGLTRPGTAVVIEERRRQIFHELRSGGQAWCRAGAAQQPCPFSHLNDGLNWGRADDYGTFIQDRWRQYANGTPYIAWSPWGGPNGTLLVTGRSILRYELGRLGNGMLINRTQNGEGPGT